MSKRNRDDESNKAGKKNYNVYESSGEDAEDKLNEPVVKPGDVIGYFANNQLGNKEYNVVLDKYGNKALEEIENQEDYYPVN